MIATATAAAARFRAKVGGGVGGGGATLGRSKMKMIDVNEVDSLNKEHAARDAAESETTHLSKKRRILEAAALQKNQGGGGIKKSKLDQDTTTETSNNPKALSQAEGQQPVDAPPMAERASAVAAAAPPHMAAAPPDQYDGAQNEEWKIMLKERSNKLSEEDRMRVQQFFQHRPNPTPGQTVVKMKLHEQRSHDPETGQPVKETFYLELDYSNFSSKQSRKVKRY